MKMRPAIIFALLLCASLLPGSAGGASMARFSALTVDKMFVDVRTFGARGDGITDDTSAIQAAIDNAAGTVYFPAGIYKITKTINLKSSIKLIGAGTGSFVKSEHPQANTGAALVWYGSGNAPMVKALNTVDIVWDGIDVDCDPTLGSGVTTRNTVQGFLFDSSPATLSGRYHWNHFRVYNCGTGMMIDPDPADVNGDTFKIENFFFWKNVIGIHTNNQNFAVSTIANGSIGAYRKGIWLQRAGYVDIRDMAFAGHGNRVNENDAYIVFGITGAVVVMQTQGESSSGSDRTQRHLLFEGGPDFEPVVLINNIFDYPVEFHSGSRKVTSIGNLYRDATRSGRGIIFGGRSTDTQFKSINDAFTNTSGVQAVISDSGTNNHIFEELPYYTTGNAEGIVYRKRFNKDVLEQRYYNSVEFNRPLQTLALNNATPNVQYGNFFKTANHKSTTITSFANGVVGQKITVFAGDGNTTINFTGPFIHGNAGADAALSENDWIDCTLGPSPIFWMCTVGRASKARVLK